MFRDDDIADPVFTDLLALDLGDVEPSMAGPKRPQDRVPLTRAAGRLRRGARQGIWQGGREGKARQGAGHQFRSRPWRRGDCRHHLLHQHVKPIRDGGCRHARPQRREARAPGQALGEDLARAGIPGRDRLSREGGLAARSRHARLQPRRLWLHHLHRQFRSAAGGNLQTFRTTDLWSLRCCRATAISRAGSITMCAPTTSPRRRWWWPTRWQAR